jgi:hypothetical protein
MHAQYSDYKYQSFWYPTMRKLDIFVFFYHIGIKGNNLLIEIIENLRLNNFC